MPPRQPMPVLFVGEPMVLRFAAIQGKPVPQLAGAALPMRAECRCAYTVAAPLVTIGTGTAPRNTDRIRVFTITITAPQHVHRIGARFLNQAIV